jgi:hypothetical protein
MMFLKVDISNYLVIDGVIVSVLTSSEVDCGSEPQSGQTKDYEISMCCFFAKQATFHDSKSG